LRNATAWWNGRWGKDKEQAKVEGRQKC